MDANEARILLGFPPNSNPSPSQVKSAYKQKVWESHPDLFPSHEKPLAESKFKLISEAYTCLLPGGRGEASTSAEYWRVVRTGVPRANGGRKNHAMIKVPFLLLILGTVALGGFNASSDTLSTTATQGLQKAEGGLPFTQSISSLMTSRAGIMPGTAYTPFAIDG